MVNVLGKTTHIAQRMAAKEDVKLSCTCMVLHLFYSNCGNG